MPRVCSTLTITDTTALNVLPAVSKVINVLSSVQFQNTNGNATQINILVGATIVASYQAAANMALPATVNFAYPIVSNANQAIQVQAVTTAANVLFSFQGETVLKI
jgi:hypothetical protein